MQMLTPRCSRLSSASPSALILSTIMNMLQNGSATASTCIQWQHSTVWLCGSRTVISLLSAPRKNYSTNLFQGPLGWNSTMNSLLSSAISSFGSLIIGRVSGYFWTWPSLLTVARLYRSLAAGPASHYLVHRVFKLCRCQYANSAFLGHAVNPDTPHLLLLHRIRKE